MLSVYKYFAPVFKFHLAQKQHDEQRLLTHHRALEFESIEDQLALAAMHYLRAHYQEAADIYKNQYVLRL